jgi:WD40 repeat protein
MESKLSYKNPYPGLRSFNINEGDLFFGRDKQISELLEILKVSRFAAISGASGSGKSSLIKAGLIPRIINDSSQWSYALMRPGNNPSENFAVAVHRMLTAQNYNDGNSGSMRSTLRRIKNTSSGLCDFLDEINFKKKLLIYIDQFEEIFRYINDERNPDGYKNASDFIAMLLNSVKKLQKQSVFLIISLRSDFLGECSQFPGLSEAINAGHYLIPKMTEEQKLEAVKGPAQKAGVEISPELSEQIKTDIRQKSDNLLVLQHAMMRTWDYRILNSDPSADLELKHYEAIGTVKNALSVHAEIIYNSLPDKESQKITERIFKALTELGEDQKGIRRPATLREISKITGYPEPDIIDVSEKFREEGNSFLMPDTNTTLSSDTVIDIAHESIMRLWERLSLWVSEETSSAQTYLRLSKSAELYQEGKAGLLVNPDLQFAMQWLKDNEPTAEWAERYDPAFERVIQFIEYSRKEYQKQLKAREEKQKQRLKRTRFVAIFLGAASLISILFLIIAFSLKIKAEASEERAKENEQIALTESKYAENQKQQAVSNELIARQQKQIAEEHRLLAEEQKEIAVSQRAIATREKNNAILAKQQVTEEKKKVEELLATTQILRDLALEREKEAIKEQKRAIAAEKRAIAERKLSASKSLAIQAAKIYEENKKSEQLNTAQKELPYQLALYAFHFFKENSDRNYDTDIFNALSLTAESNTLIRSPEGHTAAVRKAVFAPDGNEFASISNDRSLRIFNKKGERTELYDFSEHSEKQKIGFPTCISYAPGSEYLAVGDDKGNIIIKNRMQNKEKEGLVIKTHNAAVKDIVFINELAFITVGNDGRLMLNENFTQQSVPKVIHSAGKALNAIAKNEAGNRIAVSSENNSIWIFSASNISRIKKIDTGDNTIQSLSWGKGDELFAGTDKGKILILKNDSISKEFYAHASAINSIIFDKQAEQLYTCSYDKTIKIWDYDNYDYETIINHDHSWVLSLDFSEDTKQLLAAYEDKSVELIDIDINKLKNKTLEKVQGELSPARWNRFIGDDIKQENNLLRNLFDSN